MGRTLAVLLAILFLLAGERSARAQTVTAPPSVSTPKWQGGIFVDNAVRDWLRAPSASGRKTADDASTVLLYTMAAAPYATSIANVVARRGSWRDAVGLALVNSEALGIAVGATFLLKNAAGRERPYATAAGLSTYCVTHASDPQCGGDRNASFFSGHSAIAFTAAGLVCTEQIAFGPRGADTLACTSAFGVAAVTAALRIVADMHYASDTLTGAGIGVIAGMLVPYVLHFAPWAPLPVARSLRAGAEHEAKATPHKALVNVQVMPWAAPGGGGLGIGAQF